MKLFHWLKQKWSPATTGAATTPDFPISITVVEPLLREPAPIIESEILAAHAFNFPLPKQPENHCFPELTILLAAHRDWQSKVKQIMRENKSCDYNPAAVGTELMSAIGLWLDNEGKVLAELPEYVALSEAHAKLNRCAGSVLVQHQRGEFLEAVNLLRHDFAALSSEVEQTLAALLLRVREDCCPECKAHNDESLHDEAVQPEFQSLAA